jgi:Tol biopolymer transport system component
MAADGHHRRQLTSGCRCVGDPAWSPDGTEIAFDRYDKATQITHIFVVPAAGGTPTELISDTTDPGISD